MPSWEALEAACKACRQCSLADGRRNVVFGDGNRGAGVMFIGEGPGQQEDQTGIPFVGRAGQLLDDMLKVIGLDRTRVYIANIVKCRPPGNRDPLGLEQEACVGWLRKQTALVNPKIIVCLGRIAAARVIKEDFKITKEHGILFPRGSYQLMATYHPSYLLRDPRRRPEAFDDLKILEAAILEHTPETLAGA
jgi:DNA polymerase